MSAGIVVFEGVPVDISKQQARYQGQREIGIEPSEPVGISVINNIS